METTIRKLKAHLSEYLRRALMGEEVVVTLRGKPVARITPVVDANAANTLEELEKEALARLDAMPWMSPGDGGRVRGSDRRIPWPVDEKPLSQQVMEDRE
jgi:prevent-host-death family protein